MIVLMIAIIACALMIIGFGLFSIVQIRHAKQNGGYYHSLLVRLTDVNIKLIKIGAILALLGFFILVILRMVFGPTIKLG